MHIGHAAVTKKKRSRKWAIKDIRKGVFFRYIKIPQRAGKGVTWLILRQ